MRNLLKALGNIVISTTFGAVAGASIGIFFVPGTGIIVGAAIGAVVGFVKEATKQVMISVDLFSYYVTRTPNARVFASGLYGAFVGGIYGALLPPFGVIPGAFLGAWSAIGSEAIIEAIY